VSVWCADARSWSVVLVASAALFLGGLLLGWLATRAGAGVRVPARSGARLWMASLCFGMLMSIALSVVTVRFTVDLLGGPAAAAAKAPAVAKAEADGGGANDAIANAMTAIGTAVAVLALILSLGTTWFASKQKELDDRLLSVNQTLQRADRRDRLDAVSDRVTSLLPAARLAGWVWLQKMGVSTGAMFEHAVVLANRLDMLSVAQRETRGEAFYALSNMFDTSEPSDAMHAPLQAYVRACQDLAWARAEFAGELSDAKAIQRFVECGIWCDIFDPAEMSRFTRGAHGR
jgi:hypothetical protein